VVLTTCSYSPNKVTLRPLVAQKSCIFSRHSSGALYWQLLLTFSILFKISRLPLSVSLEENDLTSSFREQRNTSISRESFLLNDKGQSPEEGTKQFYYCSLNHQLSSFHDHFERQGKAIISSSSLWCLCLSPRLCLTLLLSQESPPLGSTGSSLSGRVETRMAMGSYWSSSSENQKKGTFRSSLNKKLLRPCLHNPKTRKLLISSHLTKTAFIP
jgi:hypothetical protein